MTKPSPITTHIACSMLPFKIFDSIRKIKLKQRIFQLKTNANLKNSSFHHVITLTFDLIHSFISIVSFMYPVYRCILHVVNTCIIYGFPPLPFFQMTKPKQFPRICKIFQMGTRLLRRQWFLIHKTFQLKKDRKCKKENPLSEQ